ncbi:hypothetical protein [uncultured Dialister sp.]|uniref:hypothetical protein n=1 Tax=uncultured Dialister sp. TaxID=278064 RepID=UPI0034C6A572
MRIWALSVTSPPSSMPKFSQMHWSRRKGSFTADVSWKSGWQKERASMKEALSSFTLSMYPFVSRERYSASGARDAPVSLER